MIKNPDITVIMPCFNVANYVQRAVQSVLDQTVKNFELIVVDDGSTDKTSEILLSIHDPRLKVIRLPENRGISTALNVGLQHGKGKYVASIAGDDRWLPSKLEQQLTFLNQNQLDAVGSWVIEESETDGTPQSVLNKFSMNENALHFFLTSPQVGIGSTILGKYESALEQLDEKLQTNEDWEYFARLSLRGVKFGVFPEALTVCTRRFDGLSKTRSTAEQAQAAIEKFRARVSGSVLAKSYLRSALWMINPERPRWPDAFFLIKMAIKCDWKVVFTANFFNSIRFIVQNFYQRKAQREKKYS